jgi:DNA-binding GntR family transcriptional regulator
MDTNALLIPSDELPTSADTVAHALRAAILCGRLPGGAHLRQEDLAAQLGVSRLPVREALRQLHGEGLVTLAPNRGAVVVALSPDEVQEIYDIRISLETMALRLAIPHLSPAILDHAGAILDTIERVDDVSRWCELNWDFHLCLYTPANRPHLLRLIDMMHANVDRYLRIYLSLLRFQGRSQADHRALLTACARYDAEAALGILTKHLAGARDALADYLRREEQVR